MIVNRRSATVTGDVDATFCARNESGIVKSLDEAGNAPAVHPPGTLPPLPTIQFSTLLETGGTVLRSDRLMKYYFNLAGAVHDPDNVGVDLADLGSAREHAVRFAAEYLRDRPEVVWLGEEFRLEVTNSDRLIQFTLIVLGVDAPVIRKASRSPGAHHSKS